MTSQTKEQNAPWLEGQPLIWNWNFNGVRKKIPVRFAGMSKTGKTCKIVGLNHDGTVFKTCVRQSSLVLE